MMTEQQRDAMKRVKEVIDQTRKILEASERQVLDSIGQKFDAHPYSICNTNRRRLNTISRNLMEISCDLS